MLLLEYYLNYDNNSIIMHNSKSVNRPINCSDKNISDDHKDVNDDNDGNVIIMS
jgi:hypothetical protein